MVTRRQFSKYLVGAGAGLSTFNDRAVALDSPDEKDELVISNGGPSPDCDIVIKGGTGFALNPWILVDLLGNCRFCPKSRFDSQLVN